MENKDPAYLFYSKDWLEGTAEFMLDEKGAYIDLLAHQHQKGNLPSDPKRLARIVGLSLEDFNRVWIAISPKFISEGDRLYNERLRKETDARAGTALKKRISSVFGTLIKGAELSKSHEAKIKSKFSISLFTDVEKEELPKTITKWFTHMVASLATHTEDGNEDGNENTIKDETVNAVDIESAQALVWPSFDDFWNEYDKKRSRNKAVKLWDKISQKEKEAIMEYLPGYKSATPEIQFRKDPDTFLRNRSWEDELINANGNSKTGKSGGSGRKFSSEAVLRAMEEKGYDTSELKQHNQRRPAN